MTELTLRWHLRGIVEGVTEPTTEVVGYETDAAGEWPIREETDPGSYSTGFPDDGRFCDAYDRSLAVEALDAPDVVAFLDAVAHDPARPAEWRFAAVELLSHHVMPRDDSPDGSPTLPVSYWSAVECPECHEQEVLFDPAQPDDPCRCPGCDVSISQPDYPGNRGGA